MFWSVKVVFIHVPRTGGTVLTDVFGALPWVCKDVLFHKHAKATVAKRLVGPIWKDAIKFAIERPDEEIAVRWNNHIQRYARERTAADREYCTTAWWNLVTRCQSMDFEEFCRKERVPTMDFYCDLPEVQRLPFADAYTLLRDVLGDPAVDIEPITRTSAMPKRTRSPGHAGSTDAMNVVRLLLFGIGSRPTHRVVFHFFISMWIL